MTNSAGDYVKTIVGLEEKLSRYEAALTQITALRVSREQFVLQGPAFAAKRAEEMCALADAALGTGLAGPVDDKGGSVG